MPFINHPVWNFLSGQAFVGKMIQSSCARPPNPSSSTIYTSSNSQISLAIINNSGGAFLPPSIHPPFEHISGISSKHVLKKFAEISLFVLTFQLIAICEWQGRTIICPN